jgi:hypothetical protein
MRRYEECRDLRGGMHAGSLQPRETVLSRLTGVQSKRIKDQLEIEMMITATLPVSQPSCPYRNRKAHCLARHDFLEKAWRFRICQ